MNKAVWRNVEPEQEGVDETEIPDPDLNNYEENKNSLRHEAINYLRSEGVCIRKKVMQSTRKIDKIKIEDFSNSKF